MRYQNSLNRTVKKNHEKQILFILLFFLFYPITASSRFEIGKIKGCWQSFSEDSFVKKIKESSSKDNMKNVWQEIPVWRQPDVAKQIFSEEGNTKIKQNLALVIGEVSKEGLTVFDKPKLTENTQVQNSFVQFQLDALEQNKLIIHRLLAVLSEVEEFETEEYNLIKENVVKSIKEINPKDRKTQKILVDSLELFKSEKQTGIRNEIYSFFETIAKDITTQASRKLAAKIGSYLPPEDKKRKEIADEKIRIIEILIQMKPRDTLTIQLLTKGLDNSLFRVKEKTAEALREILGKNPKSYDNTLIHDFILYPAKSIFSLYNTVKDIRLHVIEKLSETALYDPKASVRKVAIKAMVEINKPEYFRAIDTLIEIILFDGDFEVKKEAIFGLEGALTGSFNRKFFHLSTSLIKTRKLAIKELTKALYDKDQRIRRAAKKAFRTLYEEGKIALKNYYGVQTLKAKELERRIKEYETTGIGLTYDNPNIYPEDKKNTVPPPFESWFEVEVFLKIHEKGYIVLPQYVHNEEGKEKYRTDLVIVSSEKKSNSREGMLAVECDGPPHNKTDQQGTDEKKQEYLENEGWTVWRIKHSKERTPLLPYPSFYSSYPNWEDREPNPKALDKLWEELEKKEIEPVE